MMPPALPGEQSPDFQVFEERLARRDARVLRGIGWARYTPLIETIVRSVVHMMETSIDRERCFI